MLQPESDGKIGSAGPQMEEEDAVVISNGSFSWSKEKPQDVLRGINFKVKEGALVAVVGSVGAGKSSFVSALLGNMEKTNGTVSIRGSSFSLALLFIKINSPYQSFSLIFCCLSNSLFLQLPMFPSKPGS